MLVSVGSMLLASCGEDVVGPSELQGEWRLVSLTRPDSSTVPLPESTRFTLRVAEDDRIALQADCNGCGGAYQVEGRSLIAGPFACTKAFCPSAPVDTLFVSMVEGRSSLRIDEGRLVLSSDRGRLVFAR